jgi:MtN3 and saliva related transmembrane protein
MDMTQFIGLLAGTLTTIAFVPQVLKTYRSRSAKDLSLWMFLIFCTGVVFWLIYGIAIQALPVIIANALTLVLCVVLLVFKFTFKD